jgi:hypothetical protein
MVLLYLKGLELSKLCPVALCQQISGEAPLSCCLFAFDRCVDIYGVWPDVSRKLFVYIGVVDKVVMGHEINWQD